MWGEFTDSNYRQIKVWRTETFQYSLTSKLMIPGLQIIYT